MTDIRPTFHCFDDAIERLGELVRAGHQPTLVHGICTGDDGEPYAHAWVEDDGQVWDAGLIDGARVTYAVFVLDYRSAKRVGRTWRYTLLEVLHANREHGTYGPWVPELIALCSRRHRIVAKVAATYEPDP